MSSSSMACRACRNTARAVGGACADCHRTLPRLWGGRCSRCAKRHWTTGSCHDCLAWTTSLAAGRCRACREFVGHNEGRAGRCRSCARKLVVNRYRRCRLRATARREAHLAGDAGWKLEPAARGGIQLFIGDVYQRMRGSSENHPSEQLPAAVTPVVVTAAMVVEQLRLLSLPADANRLSQARITLPAPTVVLPDGLAAAVTACAGARGWKPATTTAVLRAMAVLIELGSCELTLEAVAVLRAHRLPVTRVREFLDATGMAINRPDDHDWLQAQLAPLAVQIRAEVAAWVEVLEGRHGRSRPRSPHTVRHHLGAVQPALTAWSRRCSTLREITTEDVTDQLDDLQGSARTITAVALRSLFAALKLRRLVFIDPARAVKPGRCPRVPVLGLDDRLRTSLLASLPRCDHRLVVLLAGVHALTRSDMLGLRLDDIDLDAAVMTVRGRRRPLDRLLIDTIVAWLAERQQRWPASANPHLLVTYKSAYGLGPASTANIVGIFKALPTTAAGLRADRLLDEARACGADPLRLVRLFGLSSETAVRYCNELGLDTELVADGH
jgi:hypothetical protein